VPVLPNQSVTISALSKHPKREDIRRKRAMTIRIASHQRPYAVLLAIMRRDFQAFLRKAYPAVKAER